jgi:hypothetical protein
VKALNLRCAHDQRFEGWFAFDEDEASQRERGLPTCPQCGDKDMQRLPSAPRVNLGATETPAEPIAMPAPGDLQAQWLRAVRQMMERTEDVGGRFAEEARRIHYGELQQRGIRGQASPSEAEALRDEDIEVMALALPAALKGTVQQAGCPV